VNLELLLTSPEVFLKKFLHSTFCTTALSFAIVGCGTAALNENSALTAGAESTSPQSAQGQQSAVRNQSSAVKGVASTKSKEVSLPAKLRNQLSEQVSLSVLPESSAAAKPAVKAEPILKAEPAAAAVPSVKLVPMLPPASAPVVAQPMIKSPQNDLLEVQADEFRQRILFVDLTYKVCLGRAPESEGLIFWSNTIATQKATFDSVKSGICTSLEGQLTQAYREILGRNPDATGRIAWLKELTSGRLTIAQVRQSMLESDERKANDLAAKITALKSELSLLEGQRAEIIERMQKS
jgi:hypothetical protein